MKKLFSAMLITLLWAAAALAEEPVQRVVTIKNGNIARIVRTLQDLKTLVQVATPDDEHVVLSGPKDAVANFEEIIKQLDVAPPAKKNVEVTVYMLVAASDGGATSIPPELEPAAKQLKSIFNYKTFHLLESFILRARDGESGDTTGLFNMTGHPGIEQIKYSFHFRRLSLNGADNARSVRFDNLALSLKVPFGMPNVVTYENAGISTDIDVPAGKTVVVGKTSGIQGSDSALILVISAKVVD